MAYGVPALFCYGLVFLRKPFLFGIGIAALFMTVVVSKDLKQDIVHRERSFFGVLTVTRDDRRQLHEPLPRHDAARQAVAQSVSSVRTGLLLPSGGPGGQVFSEFEGKKKKPASPSPVSAPAASPPTRDAGQEIDFYEIDPAVKRISTNPAYFTFLSDCRARWRVILGDARLTMEKAPPHHYGIIILDAFSSDSIPVHLLTREAVRPLSFEA